MLTFFRRLLFADTWSLEARLTRLKLRLVDSNERQSEILRRLRILELRQDNQEQVIRELTQENAQLVEALMANDAGELPDIDQKIIAVKQRVLKKEIFLYNRRLAELKEQAALRGRDVPPHIIIEIEQIEEKLADLER